jgi:hypothetical protein
VPFLRLSGCTCGGLLSKFYQRRCYVCFVVGWRVRWLAHQSGQLQLVEHVDFRRHVQLCTQVLDLLRHVSVLLSLKICFLYTPAAVSTFKDTSCWMTEVVASATAR